LVTHRGRAHSVAHKTDPLAGGFAVAVLMVAIVVVVVVVVVMVVGPGYTVLYNGMQFYCTSCTDAC